jgi:TPR repeat protein
MRSVIAGFALSAIMAVSAMAAPFEEGSAAYQAGDYGKALHLWLPLAQSGDRTAQFNIAVMYDQGQGVRQNLAEAERWYRRAAEQGDFIAQTNLGVMYSQGRGVEADHAEAARWYALAAAKEHGPAQFSLGTLYANGQGVEQDLGKATSLYERAELNSCTAGASTTSTRARLSRLQVGM